MKKVTMQDIADRLQISRSLVSRALSDAYGVSDETRTTIRLTALDMGYVFRPARGKARREEAGQIAIVLNRFDFQDEEYYRPIVYAIEKELSSRHRPFTLSVLDDNGSPTQTVLRGKCAGAVLVGMIAQRDVAAMLAGGLPTVLVDVQSLDRNIDRVTPHNYAGAYKAAEYLIQSGHRRLAVLGADAFSYDFTERMRGFDACMADYQWSGLTYERLALKYTADRIPADVQQVRRLLLSEQRPTAVACINDATAFLVYELAQELGLPIPKDLSVIGFGDAPRCTLATPALTSVSVSKAEMGRTAVRMLLERMGDRQQRTRFVQIDTELAVRGSVEKRSDTLTTYTSQSIKTGAPGLFPLTAEGGQNAMADFIGVSHLQPGYSFGTEHCLPEGARRIEALGSKTIKLYLSPVYREYYAPGADWADYHSPLELIQDPAFDQVLHMDFDTYIFGVFSFFSQDAHAFYWRTALLPEQLAIEYQTLYELARYLLDRFRGTGKTFIFQNWESDWSCMATPDVHIDPPQKTFDNLIKWINRRQDAVNDARRDAQAEGVYVFNCLEVNLVKKAMRGGATVTNNVIPQTYCDFYSYSCWDTLIYSDELFAGAIEYLWGKIRENQAPFQSKLMLGEFGIPECMFSREEVVRGCERALRVAREQKVSYVVYWILYGGLDDHKFADGRNDYERGFWLIKGTGEKSPAYDVFYRAIHGVPDPEYCPAAVRFPLSLSPADGETANGLYAKYVAYDGVVHADWRGGRRCLVTAAVPEGRYLYFLADSAKVPPQKRRLTVEVSYFDEGREPVILEYNAVDETAQPVQLAIREDSRTWKTARVSLHDGCFTHALQGGVADFRLSGGESGLAVDYIRVLS